MNPSVSRFARRILSVCWIFALVATMLHGAEAAAQARMSGVVKDPSQALVPGATVVLEQAGTVIATATTDDAGRFRLTQPRPGEYELIVTRAGFSELDRPLHVTQSPVGALNLTLLLADVTTSVTVNANEEANPVAPQDNKDAAAVSSIDMKNLPVFDNDIIATMTPFLDAGVVGEAGVTMIVDGVESTTIGVSASAIESVKINEDPYSAEYRQPGRGQVEVITKSTADSFHGEASFTLRNTTMYARNYFSTVKPHYERRLYEGYLTGPVAFWHDSAFLFSMTRKERDAFAQTLALTLPASGTTPAIALPAQNISAPTRDTQLSMKVSHQYNAHHSAYVLYTMDDQGNHNVGVGGLVQASAGYSNNDFDQHLTYHDDLTVSPGILNQLTLHYERDYESVINNQEAPQVIVEGVATFGSGAVDAVYTENNPTVTDIVSWTPPTHIPQLLRFGIQLPNLGRRVWEDHTFRDGIVTYADAASYAASTPSSFNIQQGQSRFITLFAQPGAFVLDQIQLTKRLTVTPGMRYDFQNTIANTKDGLLPRLSIAYLLDKDHAMVVRVGGGFYIRRVGVNIGQQLARYQFAAERSLLITSGPCLTGCTQAQLDAQPPSLFVYAPNLQAPQQGYFSLSVERQIVKGSTLTIGYNGYRGWHALRSVDINAPLPPFTSAVRPNTNYSQILQLQSEGYQKTDGMTVSYRGAYKNILSGFLQYTLQHADSNTEYSTFIPQNQYAPNDEWSRDAYDQRHKLSLFGTLFPDKPVTLGVGYYANSALPYTITTGTDVYQDGLYNARPAGIPRNSVSGGSFADLQVKLGYTRRLQPRKKGNDSSLNVSLSSFNTLNRANFENYNGVSGSPTFLQPTTANDPRRLQFQVGYSF